MQINPNYTNHNNHNSFGSYFRFKPLSPARAEKLEELLTNFYGIPHISSPQVVGSSKRHTTTSVIGSDKMDIEILDCLENIAVGAELIGKPVKAEIHIQRLLSSYHNLKFDTRQGLKAYFEPLGLRVLGIPDAVSEKLKGRFPIKPGRRFIRKEAKRICSALDAAIPKAQDFSIYY